MQRHFLITVFVLIVFLVILCSSGSSLLDIHDLSVLEFYEVTLCDGLLLLMMSIICVCDLYVLYECISGEGLL